MTSQVVNRFLMNVRQKMAGLLNNTAIHVVLGNESCDLDSAISALVYALMLNEEHKDKDDIAVLPVFNIPRADLNLKTEVVYFLNQNSVLCNEILCRNDVDLREISERGKLSLHLVDFHQLMGDDRALIGSIVNILDHRAPVAEALSELPGSAKVNMRLVGSCCTLVVEEVHTRTPSLLTDCVARLLKGTILLDTVCFSEEAGRTTADDIKAVEKCEKTERMDLYRQLVNARRDVSMLSPEDLLRKDYKLLGNLPVPGLPELVADFFKRPGAVEAATAMCGRLASPACVIIGMVIDGTTNAVTRDVAVFEATNHVLGERLREKLAAEHYLQLQQVASPSPNITLYTQGNVRATRKHIIPVIRTVL